MSNRSANGQQAAAVTRTPEDTRIARTIGLAKERFDQRAQDLFDHWMRSGCNSDAFEAHIEQIAQSVEDEVLKLWDGSGSEFEANRFEPECRAKVHEVLFGSPADFHRTLIAGDPPPFTSVVRWIKKARDVEILRLASPTAVVATANDLPALPDSVQRKHELQWRGLLEKHGFTGAHLKWPSVRPLTVIRKAPPPPIRLGGFSMPRAAKSAAKQDTGESISKADKTPAPEPSSVADWSTIKVKFLSEHNVQIFRNGNPAERLNYAEMGFADRRQGNSRGGKPNQQWLLLMELAKNAGNLKLRLSSGSVGKTQKRIERLRDALRQHFRLEADPIPCNDRSYQTTFTIELGPTFHS